jgi:cyclase
MIRERVADDVYVFTSELYAQVNAGAIVGPDWSVLVDTLAYPEETEEIHDFLQKRLGSPVRYLINTHYHADHSLGNYWFPEAVVIGHSVCRELLDTVGRQTLEEAQQQNRELRAIKLVLPEAVFEKGNLYIRVGRRTLQLLHLPGHSPDGLGVMVLEDRVLFSGDVMMPVPHIVDGDIDQMIESLKFIPKLKLENLVQGHGDVVLRGEVPLAIRENIKYLQSLEKHVQKALRRQDPDGYLASIDIESCGKSRILLAGLAEQLHQMNLASLYSKSAGQEASEAA